MKKTSCRASGALMHISSLWGEHSCGSFGKAAFEFVDFLTDCGFSYWQTLPFCYPDEFGSPYSSYSAFSVNPWFIDLDLLAQNGLLTCEELSSAAQNTPYECELTRLKAERLGLLGKAAKRFAAKEKIASFCAAHPRTEDFCRFMALREANGNAPHREWKITEPDAETLGLWEFVCYEFFRQWTDVHIYAHSKGIEIIGDIPIYVSLESADVWSNPGEFLLGEDGKPTEVAGVPPDYFSEDGQLWGNPLYDWDKMKADGYSWWCDRMAFMCELFDKVRIDHFRGLESYYKIAAGAENARNGVWAKGPGMDLIKALQKVCGKGRLIAEDLGVIDEKVEKLVKDSGCPGMRVMQFGFGDTPENPHLPHNYIPECIAYTGTHDNNTLLGYIWELGDRERSEVLRYCGYENGYWNAPDAYYAVIRTLMASVADTVIIPMQDILRYGADTRMNVPGKSEGNWRWRIKREQLCDADPVRLYEYNRLYGRLKNREE